MRRFRIVQQVNGKYIAQMQVKWHFFKWWADLFCGAMSDLPDEFPTSHHAEQRIKQAYSGRTDESSKHPFGVVVKEFEL